MTVIATSVIIPVLYRRHEAAMNERGIRHDRAGAASIGFKGRAHGVPRSRPRSRNIASASNGRADEAKRQTAHRPSREPFNTSTENIEGGALAGMQAGAAYVLLSTREILSGVAAGGVRLPKAFCEGTNLGVMLFQVRWWNFGSGYPVDIDNSDLEAPPSPRCAEHRRHQGRGRACR